MSEIKFVYFDLGNVILNFSHQRMMEQVAAVANVSTEIVQSQMFDNGLENRYETGELNSSEFHAEFCRLSESQCDQDDFLEACGDIFWLNEATMPVISQLAQLKIGLGILSNTCEAHWRCAARRFPMIVDMFPVCVKSYAVKNMKPAAEIYEAAVSAAGVSAKEIFFVDDKAENVNAAQQAGIQAFLFTDANQLLKDLTRCGVAVG